MSAHECDYCTECGCCDGDPLIGGLCASLCAAHPLPPEDDLPGLWEYADFMGGRDEVRP